MGRFVPSIGDNKMCYYKDGTPCDTHCCHYPSFFLPHVGPINLSFHSIETAYTHHSAFTPVTRPPAIKEETDEKEELIPVTTTVPTSLIVDPSPMDDTQLLDLICPNADSYTYFLDPVDMLESPIFKGKVFK